MQPVTHITSHNARIGHLRKFVAVPPDRGSVLRLVSIEEPPATLGEWMRAACVDNGSIAEDVNGLMVDHVQTLQEDVKFTLVWMDDTGGQVVTHKRFAVRYRQELDEAASQASDILGTERGILSQMQRHSEAMTRMYLAAHQTQVQMLGTLVRDLGGQLNHAHSETHRFAIEVDKQRVIHRREIEQLADQAVPEDVESSARAGMIETLTKAFETALPTLLQGGMAILAQKLIQPPANTQTVDVGHQKAG